MRHLLIGPDSRSSFTKTKKTNQEIADRLYELCRQGQFETAQDELYTAYATSTESNMQGSRAIKSPSFGNKRLPGGAIVFSKSRDSKCLGISVQ